VPALDDPRLIAEHWQALIVLTTAVVGGKIFGVTFASILSGVGTKTSIEAGMSLSQIGEFSFIIAGAGLKTGAAREVDMSQELTVALSALYRAGEPVRDIFDLLLLNMRLPTERKGDLNAQIAACRLGDRHRAGRQILLRDRRIVEQIGLAVRDRGGKLLLAVIASVAKQSSLSPRRDSGLLRYARNDGEWETSVPDFRQ